MVVKNELGSDLYAIAWAEYLQVRDYPYETRALARRLRQRVRECAEDGEAWAQRYEEDSVEDALMKVATDIKRQDRQQFTNREGEVIDLPRVIGVRKRNETGELTAEYEQLPLFLCSWDALREKGEQWRSMGARYLAQAKAVDQVIALSARYPGAATPEVALRAAGIDWRSLDIDLRRAS